MGIPAVNGAASAPQLNRNGIVNRAGTGIGTSGTWNSPTNARLNAAANQQASIGTNAAANSGAAALPTLRRNVIPNRTATANVQASSQMGLSGSVAAINATSLTFSNGGVESSFRLTPQTQFQINGRMGTFRDVPPDSNIQLFTNPRNPRQVERIVATSGSSQATQSQMPTQGAAGSRSLQQYLNGDINGGNDYFIPNEPRSNGTGRSSNPQNPPLRKFDTGNTEAANDQNGIAPAGGTSTVNSGTNLSGTGVAGSRSLQQYRNGDINGANDYFIPNQPKELGTGGTGARTTGSQSTSASQMQTRGNSNAPTPSQFFNDAANQNRILKSRLDAAKNAAKP